MSSRLIHPSRLSSRTAPPSCCPTVHDRVAALVSSWKVVTPLLLGPCALCNSCADSQDAVYMISIIEILELLSGASSSSYTFIFLPTTQSLTADGYCRVSTSAHRGPRLCASSPCVVVRVSSRGACVYRVWGFFAGNL